MNLFNGFRDMVNIQKNKLALKKSMENYEYNKKNLIASVMQYADNYNSYMDIITINEENLEASKKNTAWLKNVTHRLRDSTGSARGAGESDPGRTDPGGGQILCPHHSGPDRTGAG